MDKKNIIIFIDSLPYFYIDKMKFLSNLKKDIAKVIPGFGYSINVKAEIFGGYTPDDLGYFNEWAYDSKAALRKYYFFFSALRPLKRFYYLDRIAHKLMSRFYGHNILNIPFQYLPFFQKKGTEPYKDSFHLRTIFSETKNLKKICYYHFPYSTYRDRHIFSEALKVVSCGDHDNIFVASGDLDGVAHSYGVGSEEYDRKIEELDYSLSQVYEGFQDKYPHGNITIFSDHGMANVTQGININMDQKFGRSGEDTYLYFVDLTMLRVWTFNAKKKVEIEDYLNMLVFGKIVNREQRIKYGITSKKFGDIIFLLNEGIVFNPSFYGRKMPKGMHGYTPELESQKGFFLSLEKDCTVFKEVTTTNLYNIFKKLLNDA